VDSKTGEALFATEDGLSIYRGTFAQIRTDYTQVSGGPNPFIVGESNQIFTFTNLKINSTIKIYSISGILIRELSADAGHVDGSRAIWDGRDMSGQVVSTGIYLFAAYDQDGESTAGKIAVIRK
jgi:flagellar hook assembly protein FlgD